MRILYAEDEIALARAITKILEKNNYSVDTVYDGESALSYLDTEMYDAAILDIMMPKLDGLSVLKEIRKKGNRTPIIMLTAKSEIDDRVLGLDSGANDYLSKPFDTKELLARIRVLTRSREGIGSKLCFGNVTLERSRFELSAKDGTVRLTNKEFQIMEMLLSNPSSLISTERFMEKIWGYDSESEINVVWVYISNLRKKLTMLGADIQIKASRNAGYSLEKI